MIIRFAHHTYTYNPILPIVTEAQQATSATQIQCYPSTLSHHIHQTLISRGGSGSETRHAPTCLGWYSSHLGMTHLEREELSSHIKLVVFHLLTLYLSYTWLDGLPDLSVPILTCYTEAYYWEHRGWWAERYLSTRVAVMHAVLNRLSTCSHSFSKFVLHVPALVCVARPNCTHICRSLSIRCSFMPNCGSLLHHRIPAL